MKPTTKVWFTIMMSGGVTALYVLIVQQQPIAMVLGIPLVSLFWVVAARKLCQEIGITDDDWARKAGL